MKKLALAVTVIAFGAVMIAGCPQGNTANTSNKTDKKECGDACGDAKDGDEACGAACGG